MEAEKIIRAISEEARNKDSGNIIPDKKTGLQPNLFKQPTKAIPLIIALGSAVAVKIFFESPSIQAKEPEGGYLPTPTPTLRPTATRVPATATPKPTSTPAPTATRENTPTPKPTNTPAPTATREYTPTPLPTATIRIDTPTPKATNTIQTTATLEATKEIKPTATKKPAATATRKPVATATRKPVATATRRPVATAIRRLEATPTPKISVLPTPKTFVLPRTGDDIRFLEEQNFITSGRTIYSEVDDSSDNWVVEDYSYETENSDDYIPEEIQKPDDYLPEEVKRMDQPDATPYLLGAVVLACTALAVASRKRRR